MFEEVEVPEGVSLGVFALLVKVLKQVVLVHQLFLGLGRDEERLRVDGQSFLVFAAFAKVLMFAKGGVGGEDLTTLETLDLLATIGVHAFVTT